MRHMSARIKDCESFESGEERSIEASASHHTNRSQQRKKSPRKVLLDDEVHQIARIAFHETLNATHRSDCLFTTMNVESKAATGIRFVCGPKSVRLTGTKSDSNSLARSDLACERTRVSQPTELSE